MRGSDWASLISALAPLFGRKKRERVDRIVSALQSITEIRSQADLVAAKFQAAVVAGQGVTLDPDETKVMKALFDAAHEAQRIAQSVLG